MNNNNYNIVQHPVLCIIGLPGSTKGSSVSAMKSIICIRQYMQIKYINDINANSQYVQYIDEYIFLTLFADSTGSAAFSRSCNSRSKSFLSCSAFSNCCYKVVYSY